MTVMRVRPLAQPAKEARRLGFELAYSIDDHPGGRMFAIRLTPVSERAKGLVAIASGVPDQAIETRTTFLVDDELAAVAVTTAREALGIAKAL